MAQHKTEPKPNKELPKRLATGGRIKSIKSEQNNTSNLIPVSQSFLGFNALQMRPTVNVQGGAQQCVDHQEIGDIFLWNQPVCVTNDTNDFISIWFFVRLLDSQCRIHYVDGKGPIADHTVQRSIIVENVLFGKWSQADASAQRTRFIFTFNGDGTHFGLITGNSRRYYEIRIFPGAVMSSTVWWWNKRIFEMSKMQFVRQEEDGTGGGTKRLHKNF